MNSDNLIWLSVDNFKEILIYAWHLIPMEKQQELVKMGIYPRKKE